MRKLLTVIQLLLAGTVVVLIMSDWGINSRVKDVLVLLTLAVMVVRMKLESDRKRAELRGLVKNLKSG